MTKENNLDYISANDDLTTDICNTLSELDEKLTTMKRKVKHGKLKIQKKKINIVKVYHPLL